MKQQTIEEKITVPGINVYNGKENYATFHPAKEDEGLSFIVNGTKVPARLENAEHKKLGIALQNKVFLIEHLLSSIYSLGIDNLTIELSDNTCPTVNNCAAEYVNALKKRIIKQTKEKQFLTYTGPFKTIKRAKKPDELEITNGPGFHISYNAFYPHKVVGKQEFSGHINPEIYEKEIMHARPPGFFYNQFIKKLASYLHKKSWHGINEKNYLWILSKQYTSYANPAQYDVRYNGEEFVRHKVLDVLGTLALTGKQFKNTHFTFTMTGHHFDLYALKKLYASGNIQTL